MVEEAPQATLGAHFHRADQFQLFVRGNGRLGNAAIQPLTVHLASAFTAYGPIHAGDQGLAYLTLRNGFDPGPRYLPQAAAELRRDRSQSPHQKLIAIPEIDAAVTEASIAVLDNGPDGWGIWQRRHPPHHRVLGEDIGDGGQYWVIRRGSAVIDGVAMGPLSCLFLAKGARPPALVTTGAGVDIVVLQFAPHALNWPQAGRDHEATHNTT